MLIGGLATAAWIQNKTPNIPARATRDVDLGVDRKGLGLTTQSNRIRPLLETAGFDQLIGDEQFRFTRDTPDGEFLLDLMVAPGASREEPPIVEDGLESIAAPGLAYAIYRKPTILDLNFHGSGSSDRFRIPIAKLDAAFVMKAVLVAKGIRPKPDRRVTDTADALMLAAACAVDEPSLKALWDHKGRSDPKTAIRWVRESFGNERTAEARRVQTFFEEEFNTSQGAEWAVAASALFCQRLEDAGT